MTWECEHGYPEGDGCPVVDCPTTAEPTPAQVWPCSECGGPHTMVDVTLNAATGGHSIGCARRQPAWWDDPEHLDVVRQEVNDFCTDQQFPDGALHPLWRNTPWRFGQR